MDNLYVPRMVWRVLCEEIIKRLYIKTLNIFKWWGGSIKSFAPFVIPFDYPEYPRKRDKRKSTVCTYAIQWIFTLLFHPLEYSSLFTWYLSETIISNSDFIFYFILLSHWNILLSILLLSILDFNLSSHWNLPLSIYLFDDLMNYPIGFYLSLFKYRFCFLNYSFWWSVPLSLDF